MSYRSATQQLSHRHGLDDLHAARGQFGHGLGRLDALTAGVDGVRVDDTALLVDRACDKMGRTLEQQRACRARDHVNVLKVGSGDYWMINLDRPEAVRLAHEPELRGHRFEVRGAFYPKIGTVQVDEFRDLGLIADLAWF